MDVNVSLLLGATAVGTIGITAAYLKTLRGPVQKPSMPSHGFEFGGPIGAVGTAVGLPVGVLILTTAIRAPTFFESIPGLLPSLSQSVSVAGVGQAMGVLVGWFAFQVVLERCLPCQVVEGMPLPDKTRLKYNLNGHSAFWVSVLAARFAWPTFSDGSVTFGPAPLGWCYDHLLDLAAATVIFCTVGSAYLYARSFARNAMLAEGGNTGVAVYDFFIGRELNPRIGSFDLKYFCELRPGLIGWVMLNAGMLMKQQELYGEASWPMILVNIFQAIYVCDALFFERSILSTMDITTDGFGFMLCFGDLVWVPFAYSLQSQWLVSHDISLSTPHLLAIVAVKALGYFIFRGSNLQKDRYRRDPSHPDVAHLTTMPTKRGTKLIISGWWGLARKINYTGDWTMALSWCLPCGFSNPLPYFYFVYLVALLSHRAWRDEAFCQHKYGDDWTRYKSVVRSVFIPGVI